MTRRRFIKTIAKGTLLSALAMLPNAAAVRTPKEFTAAPRNVHGTSLLLISPIMGKGCF